MTRVKPARRIPAAVAAAAALLMASPAAKLTGTVEAVAAEAEHSFPVLPKSLLRTWQVAPFQDFHTKVLLLECSRQIGKSHALSEWSAARLLLRLQEADQHLIVIISNSKANGVEIGQKAAAALRRACEASAELRSASISGGTPESIDTALDPEMGPQSGVPDLELSDFAQRIEIRIGNKRGRILVLAASPRTARGFSGDLVLDEFAFHENAAAIWDAAEPMLDSNPAFVARIASTHNGVGSLFNTWIKGKTYKTFSVRRSDAYYMGAAETGSGHREAMARFWRQWRGLGPRNRQQARAWWKAHGSKPQAWDRMVIESKRFTDAAGKPRKITPEEALAENPNRISYLQNYENEPAEAGGAFLGWDTITKAEAPELTLLGADKQEWSPGTLQRLHRLKAEGGTFYIGQDFARTTDLSVVTVLHDHAGTARQVARLEMQGRTSPQQRVTMETLLSVTSLRTGRVVMDATGNGMGLAEELADKHGSLILLVNFSETVPMDEQLSAEGRRQATMGIPERMAIDLSRAMEDGRVLIMGDEAQRQDLRKPCRLVKGNRVSIAAARTAGDHADRFWALALAEHGRREGDASSGYTMDMIQGCQMGTSPCATLRPFNPSIFTA